MKKLKPITLIVALILAISFCCHIYNIYESIRYSVNPFTTSSYIYWGMSLLKDASLCIFFLTLYKNQK